MHLSILGSLIIQTLLILPIEAEAELGPRTNDSTRTIEIVRSVETDSATLFALFATSDGVRGYGRPGRCRSAGDSQSHGRPTLPRRGPGGSGWDLGLRAAFVERDDARR